MAGAVGLSIVGSGYMITDKTESDVTVVRYLDNYHICLRRTPDWKEIIADTGDALIAKMVASQILLIHETSLVRTDISKKPPCRRRR